METPRETLTGTGIELVRWRPYRLDELVAAVQESQAHLGAWLPWATGGYERADGAEFLTRVAGQWDAGGAYEYALLAPDGTLLGSCGLVCCVPGGRAEIGYWLGLSHTGRGLMTSAASLLVAEAFRAGAEYVEIRHDERNTRSGAVAERLGFTPDRQERTDGPIAPSCSGISLVWRKDRP
ncbi:GNAT family N-acetyltransferase [Amycolatopsis sp. PS_44_ISF1]|uniref:GNAT family N-acetyltransferase n=1 Tax=Amycolatopsis sp. PS_44_ISF1 TaxID=2974917 RepID=UPI0028DDE586|nr:GNAT family N-acetyltransferase [Amycolatopsis sp. PS_44_ISF1]MDT8913919.1 GNAT family N-acetyltransferase [Amycolatopsis sp. PS_44_ISF1]